MVKELDFQNLKDNNLEYGSGGNITNSVLIANLFLPFLPRNENASNFTNLNKNSKYSKEIIWILYFTISLVGWESITFKFPYTIDDNTVKLINNDYKYKTNKSFPAQCFYLVNLLQIFLSMPESNESKTLINWFIKEYNNEDCLLNYPNTCKNTPNFDDNPWFYTLNIFQPQYFLNDHIRSDGTLESPKTLGKKTAAYMYIIDEIPKLDKKSWCYPLLKEFIDNTLLSCKKIYNTVILQNNYLKDKDKETWEFWQKYQKNRTDSGVYETPLNNYIKTSS